MSPRLLLLAMLLGACTRKAPPAAPPAAAPATAPVVAEPIDTADCLHPDSLALFHAYADALAEKRPVVEGGKRYSCLAADRLADAACYKAATQEEADRLNVFLKERPPAFEVAGKLFTCVDTGSLPTPDCYVAKTKQEFERLLPHAVEGGVEVDGHTYKCLKNGASK